jgi:copper transporter 1
MSYMPGCSVRTLCSKPETASKLGGEYCSPLSQLADVCRADMPRMGGCAAYSSMCNNPNSVVAQCLQQPMIPGLPGTDRTIELIKSVCNEMTMVSRSSIFHSFVVFFDP